MKETYSFIVEGLELSRPFQISRLGHFGINVADPKASLDFYERLLGLEISDTIDFSARIPESIRAIVGPDRKSTRLNSSH